MFRSVFLYYDDVGRKIRRSTTKMKHLSALTIVALLLGCQSTNFAIHENGKVVMEQRKVGTDSTCIKGFIAELSTGEKLQIADIWLGNHRYDCDTNGRFNLQIKPGRYTIETRSFGFRNVKYRTSIRKGEQQSLQFFLVPYKSEKPSKQIH